MDSDTFDQAPLGKVPPKHGLSRWQLIIAGTVVWEVTLIVMALAFAAADTRLAEAPREKPLPKFRAPAVGEDGKQPVPANEDAKPQAVQAKKEMLVPAACAVNLGTQIQFVKDPPDAFQQARKEKKLVFLMHLAGNFEEAKFT
jgi:hypothetical protein